MIAAVAVNFVAVIVAAVVSMAIGMAWYSPALFGKEWMKLSRISPQRIRSAKAKGMEKTYVIGFIVNLIMAYVLAHTVYYSGARTAMDGAFVGFFVWLGFIATVMLGMVLWEGKPVKLYVINAGHYLVSLLVMGAILAVWV